PNQRNDLRIESKRTGMSLGRSHDNELETSCGEILWVFSPSSATPRIHIHGVGLLSQSEASQALSRTCLLLFRLARGVYRTIRRQDPHLLSFHIGISSFARRAR